MTSQLFKEMVSGLGHTCFDGTMHIQSLLTESDGLRKLFAFRKFPFVQIISGLKNPNIVMTVHLKLVNNAQMQNDKQKN